MAGSTCEGCGLVCVWDYDDGTGKPHLYNPFGGVERQESHKKWLAAQGITDTRHGTVDWMPSGVRHDTTCIRPYRIWCCFVCKLNQGASIMDFRLWEYTCVPHLSYRDTEYIPTQGPYKGKKLTLSMSWLAGFRARKESEIKAAQKKLRKILSTQAVHQTLDQF